MAEYDRVTDYRPACEALAGEALKRECGITVTWYRSGDPEVAATFRVDLDPEVEYGKKNLVVIDE